MLLWESQIKIVMGMKRAKTTVISGRASSHKLRILCKSSSSYGMAKPISTEINDCLLKLCIHDSRKVAVEVDKHHPSTASNECRFFGVSIKH